jgi:hypothetical protein
MELFALSRQCGKIGELGVGSSEFSNFGHGHASCETWRAPGRLKGDSNVGSTPNFELRTSNYYVDSATSFDRYTFAKE